MTEPAAVGVPATAPRVPLCELGGEEADLLAAWGAKPLNLYRGLANAPELLRAWIDFAWTLRTSCRTPRSLRELMVLRGAQLSQSAYEWQQHLAMALGAGVLQEQIDDLADWATSTRFSNAERAALSLAEDVLRGRVEDDTWAAISDAFGERERVELTLTAAWFALVPRVLDALQIPLEPA